MRLIDADALKKAIPKAEVDGFQNCRYCTLLDDIQVKNLIDNAPTVERTGILQLCQPVGIGIMRWKCSECGEVYEKPVNYCSQCGFKLIRQR